MHLSDTLPKIFRCLAVSSDGGIHFTKPLLGVVSIDGRTANNCVWPPSGGSHETGTVFIDAKPGVSCHKIMLSCDSIAYRRCLCTTAKSRVHIFVCCLDYHTSTNIALHGPGTAGPEVQDDLPMAAKRGGRRHVHHVQRRRDSLYPTVFRPSVCRL